MTDQSSEATAGGGSTPDITALSLEAKGRQSPSGKKRPADSDLNARRGKAPAHTEIFDEDRSRDLPHAIVPERTRPKPTNVRLLDSRQAPKSSLPHRTPEASSEWSAEANRSQSQSRIPHSPLRPATKHPVSAKQTYIPKPINPTTPRRQAGAIENQKQDTRYPGLLLQPVSADLSRTTRIRSEVHLHRPYNGRN